MAVSPAITPAKPGLYADFWSVVMLVADSINDTPFDKSSVVPTRPILRCRVVFQKVVELLPGLHLVEPNLLRAALFQCPQKFLARFHRNTKRALWKNHPFVTKLGEVLKWKRGTFAELGHVRH